MSLRPPLISRAAFLGRLATLALAAVVVVPNVARGGGRRRKPFPHPEPREGITAEHVLPLERMREGARSREAYAFARVSPELFDGLYCACRCQKSHGHRSLLACFESEQPTGCMGCQDEAILAGTLLAKGKSLADIRHAVDEEWG